MSSEEEFLDEWTFERVKNLYPDFENGVNRIMHVPIGADKIQTYDGMVYFEHTLWSGENHSPVYNIAFKYGVLYIQNLFD